MRSASVRASRGLLIALLVMSAWVFPSCGGDSSGTAPEVDAGADHTSTDSSSAVDSHVADTSTADTSKADAAEDTTGDSPTSNAADSSTDSPEDGHEDAAE